MELLGQYQSSLIQSYYEQLLALLNTAITEGDLAGGSAFNTSTLVALEQDAQAFGQLPTATANTRVTDDSFNYPLSLLQARLNSIQAEVDSFTTVSGRLLQILENETDLVDRALAADQLSQWQAGLLNILDAWVQAWSFDVGLGPQYQALPPIDPSNSVEYTSPVTTGDTFSVTEFTESELISGLQPPMTQRTFPPKNLIWTFPDDGISQVLNDPDFTWTQLDIIANEPTVQYTNPLVQVIIPQGGTAPSAFNFSGNPTGGIIPTYIRILFYPRDSVLATNVTDGVPVQLSPYSIDPNVINIMSADGLTEYQLGPDFTANQAGTITPIDMGSVVSVVIYFTEYWPAYQCSLDQTNWSSIIMLDPNRLYPDNTINFMPIDLLESQFPVIDETGLATGVYFSLNTTVGQEYTLLVSTPAVTMFSLGGVPAWGPAVTLEIDPEQPSYMTGISISPYSAFPMLLTKVELQGLTSNTLAVSWIGSYLLEGDTVIQWPRQLVSKIILTLVQNSYTIKEYQQTSSDALRRNVMNAIESTLPAAIHITTPAIPTIYRGYQYEWGLENIIAIDQAPILPGVFVQGPFTIEGTPEAFRYDNISTGTVDTYLCYFAYSSVGALLDSNQDGFLLIPGNSICVPYGISVVVANVASMQVGLRFVLRSADASVAQYQLQAVFS